MAHLNDRVRYNPVMITSKTERDYYDASFRIIDQHPTETAQLGWLRYCETGAAVILIPTIDIAL